MPDTDKFDVQGTIDGLIAAIEDKAKKGWGTISTLVATQSKMLAQQAAWIAESTAFGSLKTDGGLRQMFLDQLAGAVRQLGHTVAALTVLTLEQVWNAAVGVLWGAINKFLSATTGGFLVLPVL